MIRWIFVFCLFIFLSCKNNSAPSGIIKPNKMQEILWDIYRADAFSRQLVSVDSTRSRVDENARLTDTVFLIHKITRQQFEKSYSYYTEHPDLLRTMLDSINVQKERINNWEMSHRGKNLNDSSKPLTK